MKTLSLTLNKRWFDMIASGEKLEEYREIKPYWITRLIYNANREESRYPALDIMESLTVGGFDSIAQALTMFDHAYLYRFDVVSANNGYAKDCPNIKWEHKGIRIGTGKTEWGAEPGRQYFILEIGNILELNNIKS